MFLPAALLFLFFGAPQTVAPEGVGIQASGVNLRLNKSVVVEIRYLRGIMHPTHDGEPVSLDDVKSFDVHVSYATIAMTTGSLSSLMNEYVFAYEGAPLKDIRVETVGQRLRITGTMHKGVGIPFSLEGELKPDGDGHLRLHADKFSAAHLPMKGLIHMFGEGLAKIVNTNEARGLRIEGDDIVLFPSSMTPPPHIMGPVTKAGIEPGRIVQTFGSPSKAQTLKLPRNAKNYVYHRGGVMRFGKLTMRDTDLELIGMDSSKPFEFYLAEYRRQLVAGYTKNTPASGLIVYMPDLGKLTRKQ